MIVAAGAAKRALYDEGFETRHFSIESSHGETLIHPGAKRYVISMRMTGLGDRLICLGAAWCFARNTGRVLVADWRFSQYSPDLDTNLFPFCFEASPELAGVPFIGDDTIRGLSLPVPRHPALWNDDRLLKAPFFRPRESLISDRDSAVALVRSGNDVSARTVVFDTCVNDGLVLTKDSQTFLGSMRPVSDLTAKVTGFRDEHLGAGPIIGLHMRHGNGGITGHDSYWHSFRDSIDRCALAIKRCREQLGKAARVFLCTDSAEVERAICKRVPHVVCRSKLYRRPGDGELHLWSCAHRVREDAMVEMLLLAECDALIRYPPGSFFSFYAAVMRRWRSPVPETVYDLQRPSVPEDPFSPALLL